jgi:hypothetical protein
MTNRFLLAALILVAIGFVQNAKAGPLECYERVSQYDTGILRGMAVELCGGAQSNAPADCYHESFQLDGGMIRGIAIDLCKGSTNAKETLACYLDASARGMNRGMAVQLCAAVQSHSER